MVNKYCKFLRGVYDGKLLIWNKNKEYLVTYENEDNYYFGKPITKGIAKEGKDKIFRVIEKEGEDI